MDKILINGLQAWGKHGVFDFEQNHSQPFTVDIELWADLLESFTSDDLQNTINYADIYNIVKSVIETQSFQLIERLTYVLLEKIFLYDKRIQKIKIRVMKNKAPLDGQVNYVGIELEKNREHIITQNNTTDKQQNNNSNTSTPTAEDAATTAKLPVDMGYKVVLALGSNVGDRQQSIQNAIKMLTDFAGVHILNKSKLYETEPVGYVDQEKFYNAAVFVKTTLNPFDLYLRIKNIENTLGRKKTFKWGPRAIDIDIIAYEGCVIKTTGLTLPHKEYMQRAFVLKPLSDMPDAVEAAGLNMQLIEKMLSCANDNTGIKPVGNL
ncbi:MAG: 2-amino-4-hydroxy-6-hydroxymethyldihydropteridine diphosphokinase [Nitrososphaerota archaeon]|jgi:dihydroneopterin aldolase/2-amino-4-hydroxy-6-hydroxymethyldihydropteridine diphosphokinase|nr:2-amino-4-hydroxy-6-hydroxymethyldihydropteridine diphosphokinase [Nitrososphaerota archaeon]